MKNVFEQMEERGARENIEHFKKLALYDDLMNAFHHYTNAIDDSDDPATWDINFNECSSMLYHYRMLNLFPETQLDNLVNQLTYLFESKYENLKGTNPS